MSTSRVLAQEVGDGSVPGLGPGNVLVPHGSEIRRGARGEGWGSHAVADPSDSTPGRHSYVFGNVTRAVVGEYALSTLMASYWVTFGA